MDSDFPRLERRTLVEDFITRFEEMILTGKLMIGEKLPSERDLAQKLGVSRPVVHDGLLDLAAKGLITRYSSGGAVVNDYRRQGSLPLLNTLMNYQEGTLETSLLNSTMDFRMLFEVESARLAALNRSENQVSELLGLVEQEKTVNPADTSQQASLDFQFHHLIAMASGNIFYPLLLNSCRPLYVNFASLFYSLPGNHPQVVKFHEELTTAVDQMDATEAHGIMIKMLEHGYSGYISGIQSKD